MEAQKSESATEPSASAPSAAATSCRKKKSEEAAFLEDIKDHIDEFVHASMDEHKACFKKTINKMFGLSRKVAEKEKNAEQQEVESILPLQTTISN
uniref:Uncharacterized protein n=1 Tax=Chenopodium quinoa TaxID=63459 RepID=A0A803LYV9_CHEQI